jgi:pimeloyl-ACP methyl ester carboxylesterase
MNIEKFEIALGTAVASTKDRIRNFPWDAFGSGMDSGWANGVSVDWLRNFCLEWSENYDWKRVQQRLNRLDHVVGVCGNERLHAVHFRGSGRGPLLVLVHGWPSTFLEFIDIAGKLSKAGIDVLVPSLPGYPFSSTVNSPLGPREAAASIARLVRALGYTQFFAHGGDWGAEISVWLGLLESKSCRGVHLAMRGLAGNEPECELHTPAEREWKHGAALRLAEGGLYMQMQTRETLTLAYCLADSPVGAAAWICDKFLRWTDGRGAGYQGAESILGREFLLSTVTLFCATRRVASSLWMYPGYTIEQQIMPHRLELPVAIFALPNDPVFPWPPRALLDRHYNVVRWTEPPYGAHFAALETPELLLSDLVDFCMN